MLSNISAQDADRALSCFYPGARVFLHAGPSESQTFAALLQANPERARGVNFIGVFIPGVNAVDYTNLAPDARVTTTFVPPFLSKSFAAGRIHFLPKSYSGFARWLLENPVDVAVVRVSPPDADGVMSYGINQDFAPIATRFAKKIIALVDQSMPSMMGERGLRRSDCAVTIEIDEKLRNFPTSQPDERLAQVGLNASALIRDGDTIQIGVGKVQAAILSRLFDRKDLGLHSGLIDDSIAALAEKGILTNKKKSIDRGLSVAGMTIGAQAAIAYSQEKNVRFRAADYTHSAATLSQQDQFIAINSALEVDLFGQCNAEFLNGRQISGAGGFHDFQRGALSSKGGRSLVALPATAGAASRIVAKLDQPGVVTGPRNDADFIITEYGVAAIGALDLEARANALIGIAAPDHQASLAEAWRAIRKAL